jgi:hypothetical protein
MYRSAHTWNDEEKWGREWGIWDLGFSEMGGRGWMAATLKRTCAHRRTHIERDWGSRERERERERHTHLDTSPAQLWYPPTPPPPPPLTDISLLSSPLLSSILHPLLYVV